ncbi:hypothetical protein [Mesorhizobium sp. M2A.F.Ca.ET.042.01.1.1]|nr:hypothetical protein [Mesorhizobium sp. M2A.F.Ca.ET.042.01.1.1]
MTSVAERRIGPHRAAEKEFCFAEALPRSIFAQLALDADHPPPAFADGG